MGKYDKPTDVVKKKGKESPREAAEHELQGQAAATPVAQEARPQAEGLAASITQLINKFFELPVSAQLGVLRTIAPKVLATLELQEQEGFLRDLGTELARAEQGQDTYDIRPPGEQQPSGPVGH